MWNVLATERFCISYYGAIQVYHSFIIHITLNGSTIYTPQQSSERAEAHREKGKFEGIMCAAQRASFSFPRSCLCVAQIQHF